MDLAPGEKTCKFLWEEIMTQNQKTKKIDYVKPEILDLGPITAALGGSCTPNGDYPTGKASCVGPGDWVSTCSFGDGVGLT